MTSPELLLDMSRRATVLLDVANKDGDLPIKNLVHEIDVI